MKSVFVLLEQGQESPVLVFQTVTNAVVRIRMMKGIITERKYVIKDEYSHREIVGQWTVRNGSDVQYIRLVCYTLD